MLQKHNIKQNILEKVSFTNKGSLAVTNMFGQNQNFETDSLQWRPLVQEIYNLLTMQQIIIIKNTNSDPKKYKKKLKNLLPYFMYYINYYATW